MDPEDPLPGCQYDTCHHCDTRECEKGGKCPTFPTTAQMGVPTGRSALRGRKAVFTNPLKSNFL